MVKHPHLAFRSGSIGITGGASAAATGTASGGAPPAAGSASAEEPGLPTRLPACSLGATMSGGTGGPTGDAGCVGGEIGVLICGGGLSGGGNGGSDGSSGGACANSVHAGDADCPCVPGEAGVYTWASPSLPANNMGSIRSSLCVSCSERASIIRYKSSESPSAAESAATDPEPDDRDRGDTTGGACSGPLPTTYLQRKLFVNSVDVHKL